MNLKADETPKVNSEALPDLQDRREVFKKLGKFAAYAAPFAALAVTQKASAASGGGPRKHGTAVSPARRVQ
jgi:hypothetical protein